jgi:hypothetical protein
MGYVTDESWFTGWVTGFGYFTDLYIAVELLRGSNSCVP